MIAPIRSEIRLRDVMRSLFFNRGYAEKLVTELLRYFGVKKVLLTHSGRTGLYFLLKALPQKKVYLPAYNCWAVTEAARYAQKEIEYVDISLEDYNMDVEKLRNVLAADSIIVATHQFGIPCDMEAIMELARERNCVVLEDNAPSLGAEIKGKKTGTFGAAAILSFDYSKTVVSGKGGAVLFNDEELYQRVSALYRKEVMPPGLLKSMRYVLVALAYSYATHRWVYPFTYAAFKRIRGASKSPPKCDLTPHNESYRFGYDELRAKLAYLGMKRLKETVERRRAIADVYLNDVACNDRVVTPVIRHDAKAVLVKFPFRLKGLTREHVYERGIKGGVDLAFLFQFHYGNNQNVCPNARAAAEQALALPVYSTLNRNDLIAVKSVIDDERQ